MARYEREEHIFVTSKFVESSEPLEDLSNFVMIEEEFQKTIRELNQTKGIDLLSAPSIVMRPFQEGKVEIMREFIYPMEYDPPKILTEKEKAENGITPVMPATPTEFKTRNTGVELAIYPRIFEDGSIELTLEPKVLEFLGFQNFGQSLFVLDKGPLGKTQRVCISVNRIEMPVFERRDIKTRIRIPNGATVAIGGLVKTDVQSIEDKIPLLGDLPLIGQVARSKGEITVHRHLYVFVTAKRIDPAGIPVSEQND
jgi:general secretion pathway protein D